MALGGGSGHDSRVATPGCTDSGILGKVPKTDGLRVRTGNLRFPTSPTGRKHAKKMDGNLGFAWP